MWFFRKSVLFIGCSLLVCASAKALAFDLQDAKQMIADFSHISSCGKAYEDLDSLHAVEISDESEVVFDYGRRFAVAWQTDIECSGGNGATGWYISFVGVGAGSSGFLDLYTDPIRLPFLKIDLMTLNEEGNIYAVGEAYDPREGSGNWDFVGRILVIDKEGRILESKYSIEGKMYDESYFEN
ncbi:hypothetical protein ACLUEY_14030 [Vreelandella aquamarina]